MHSEPSQTANTEFSTNLILSGELELNLGSIKLVHSTLFSDSPSKIYDSCNFSIVKKKMTFAISLSDLFYANERLTLPSFVQDIYTLPYLIVGTLNSVF